MRVRIVVADRSEVRFYDASHINSHMQLVGQMTDAQARQYLRDLETDRPGRRRGPVAAHAMGGERDSLQHEAEVFAQRIAGELEKSMNQHEFERVVLVAEPGFMGQLRSVMPKSVLKAVAQQVNKGLIRQNERTILDHVSAEVFQPPMRSLATLGVAPM